MKKRITIEFDENDELYKKLIKYVNDNYLTFTSVIKQSLSNFLKNTENDL